MCCPALWGVVRGGAHKTDLKGAQEVSSKAVGTRLRRKGAGDAPGSNFTPHHFWNDQNRDWVGRWVRPPVSPTGILKE